MFATLASLIALVGLLSGQEKVDPKIAIEALKTSVAGQAQEDLTKVAEAWLVALQAKESELAVASAAHAEASGTEKKEITNSIEVLREERTQLVDRLEVVLAAIDAKGGDSTKFRSYIDALPNHVDFKDPNAVWQWVVNWVKSPSGGIKWGLSILKFLAILIGFRFLSRIAANILSRALSTSRLEVTDLLRDFFVNSVRKVVFLVGIVMALGQVGIDVGPLLAGIGVVGFIIGFALQGTLSNFASGVMILMYRPYDVGHVIEAAGARGKVSEMSLVSTTLLTPDNQIVVIPNSSIWGGVILNVTGNPTRRLDLVIGIGYEDNIDKAMTILEELLGNHEMVLPKPEPIVRLDELADSSVNFVVRPWCKTGDYVHLKWDLLRAVKKRFDAEGISIPYPQQDVHVHQVN